MNRIMAQAALTRHIQHTWHKPELAELRQDLIEVRGLLEQLGGLANHVMVKIPEQLRKEAALIEHFYGELKDE